MSDKTTLLPCPFCGGNNVAASYHSPFIICEDCGAFGPGSADSTHDEAIAAWNTRAMHGTLTAEQVRDVVEKHWHDLPNEHDMPEATALSEYSYDWHAIADELNATLGSGECESRWFELFGTPEKVADMLPRALVACSDCVLEDECIKRSDDARCLTDDKATLIEWLRGKAVKR